MIRYLKHTEIDKAKWNHCVSHSSGSLIYAFSWYLDIVCPNWHALVLGDYEAIMPLAHKKKLFISYLYQPFFTQQLGVFSTKEIQPSLVSEFIDAIPKHFKYIDIFLNEENDNETLKPRKNYILTIEEDYKEISLGYKGSVKRNLRKAKENNLFLQPLPYSQVVDFFVKNKGGSIKGLKLSEYNKLKKLYKICNKQNSLISLGVYSKQNGLLSCGVFLVNQNRIIFHIGTSNKKGRKLGAMHCLMDGLISQMAGSNFFIDFEGSEIEGIESFYKSFGASKRIYFSYKKNNLPKFISWIKK